MPTVDIIIDEEPSAEVTIDEAGEDVMGQVREDGPLCLGKTAYQA